MKVTTKRQETKYIAGNDFYCNYFINVKLLYEDQNDTLNERLRYTNCQFPTQNKKLCNISYPQLKRDP